MEINELVSHSAILYCGIYNIYDKEKRILNKIDKVIDDVFNPLVSKIKEIDEKISKDRIIHYCDSIDENREVIITNVEKISQLSNEVVEKVLADISSVGLVFNDDIDNFESYNDNQKKIVLNFLKATESKSIKAFKKTYDDKEEYFHLIIDSLKKVNIIATKMSHLKGIDPLVATMLDKIKVDVEELTQDIIDMGKPKENLLSKLNI